MKKIDFYAEEILPEVSTLAAIEALDPETNFSVGCDLLVTYKNGNDIYVTDGTAWGHITTTTPSSVNAGEYLNGFSATYNATTKTIIPDDDNEIVACTASAIEAPETTTITASAALTSALANQPVVFKNVFIPAETPATNTDYTGQAMTDYGSVSLTNAFTLDTHDSGTYDISGYVSATGALLPTNLTPVPTNGFAVAENAGYYSADNVTLTDGVPYVSTQDVVVTKIIYNRTYSNTENWKAWYAPFAISADQFDEAVEFTAADSERNILQFQTVSAETLSANTPYLVKVKETNEIYSASGTLKAAESAVVIHDGYSLTGIYEPRTDMTGDYGLAADGVFHLGSATAVLQPFRFYLTIPAPKMDKPLRMTVDGEEVTGINDAIADILSDDVWYDMQGRAVAPDNLQPGIYIHNGRKQFIPANIK